MDNAIMPNTETKQQEYPFIPPSLHQSRRAGAFPSHRKHNFAVALARLYRIIPSSFHLSISSSLHPCQAVKSGNLDSCKAVVDLSAKCADRILVKSDDGFCLKA